MNNLRVEGLYLDGDGYLDPYDSSEDSAKPCGCCKVGSCKCRPIPIREIKDKVSDAVKGECLRNNPGIVSGTKAKLTIVVNRIER